MTVITLTTDFGTRDWFVGTMKGVIATLAPSARVVDLTHEVALGDVRGGAFALAAAAPFFPTGSIHLAVVDPGVGSARRAIAVRTPNEIFVGPDNGVLWWALRATTILEVRELANPAWFLKPLSRTFHGRDVFAPVAAHLAVGARFSEVGGVVDRLERLPWPVPVKSDRRVAGEGVYVDRFGNAITSIFVEDLPADAVERGVVRVRCQGATAVLHSHYAAAGVGEALAVAGSNGLVELAVNGGAFAREHGAVPGASVEVSW